ncbi:V-type ATP synthase subunit I domain-containing protein [Anaerococcus lactolyticus]|uniref:Uncharacterized protein n=1 Tax=Anaerococcus lactolyticus S7-1-13 TaxID=1284686 RepID=A0A095Z6P4_9FIRM|nr:hypothetical protein [Anaerococcus lactolyticus]KGF04159.1 hypothetical protein HMPREF1630_05040 [Anaerococcus lactolyticus S7-1-13]
MAVEKMNLVNITSRLENLTDLLKDVINIGQIEPIDAFGQVASRAFSVKASSENVELTEDMNNITSFHGLSKEELEKLNYLKRFFDISDDEEVGEISKVISKDELERLYTRLEPMIKRREELVEEKDKLLTYKNNLEILTKANVDIEKIKHLNYFDFRYGDVTKDGRFILKNNYENIPSLIIHLDDEAVKSADALNTLIELDNKTSQRRKSVDEIIENEKSESLRVANKIDQTFFEKLSSEVANLNANNDEKIKKEALEIKNSFSDRKNHIESLYKEKVDLLVDNAFNKIIEGDGNDR